MKHLLPDLARAVALAAFSCVIMLPVAHATILPGVRVEVAPSSELARAGELYRGRLVVQTELEGTVSNLEVLGEGWNVLAAKVASQEVSNQGTRFELDVTAIPRDASRPLAISFRVGGRHLSRSISLTRSATVFRVSSGADEAAPALPDRPDLRQSTQPDSRTQSKKNRSIRVRGTLRYIRNGGASIGADSVAFTVYDSNSGAADLQLATGTTDQDGDFDVTFTWAECPIFCEADPDIYVRFETVGSVLDVMKGSTTYVYETDTEFNYAGTNLDFGVEFPAGENANAALGLMTNVMRGWRWVKNNTGFDIPKVTVDYPDDSNSASFYIPAWEEIHIRTVSQWQERVILHEYGHHFINHFAKDEPVSYCNGICDPDQPNGDCGHCLWCEEREFEAWTEGWPDWFSQLLTSTFEDDYGLAALSEYEFEDILACDGDGVDDPLKTEGIFAAALWDIYDGDNEDDDVSTGFSDLLSLGADEIFAVSTDLDPTTPAQFFADFRAAYPAHDTALWETLKNNLYELDSQAPGLISNLTSSSHPIGQDSPDDTPTFTWTAATDDLSGIGGYSVAVQAGSPPLPDATQDIGAVTSYTHTALSPGIYYFGVRSVDRAGNWDATARTYGPFEVRAATTADLTFTSHSGWAEYVVPRSDNTATSSNVPLSLNLPGNQSTTYWNLRGRNIGESSTGVGFVSRCYVDDVYRYWASWNPIGANGVFWGTNLGAINVLGGRHTFETRVDALGDIAESDESNNTWAKQWIWLPLDLFNAGATRGTPPDITGGWDAVPVGEPTWYNCDGIRYFQSSAWQALYLRPLNNTYDYDLRQHMPMTSVTDGFGSNVAWSSRSAGLLDAVFANSWGPGVINPMEAGVLNWSGGSGNYEVVSIPDQNVNYNTLTTLSLEQDEYMLIARVTGMTTGWRGVTLEVGPGHDPVRMGWFPATVGSADMHDFMAETVTDAEGKARLDINVTETGFPLIVVWRDPVETSTAEALDVDLMVAPTPPDLTPYALSGWHSPFVPRMAADGTVGSVPRPTQLIGETPSTYLNASYRNDSPVAAGFHTQNYYVDGTARWFDLSGSLNANTTLVRNSTTARNIDGGRHTLSMALDPGETLTEIDDQNNIHGEQWVWQPLTVAAGAAFTRDGPPERTKGWDHITTTELRWYNCDGLRTPVPPISGQNGWWGGFGAIARDDGDVDVRIHEVDTGAKEGFQANLAFSTWGPTYSDFVLVNFRNTTPRGLDVGVLREDGVPYEVYDGQFAVSEYMGADPMGGDGPYTMAANGVLGLHEMDLSVGEFTFTLTDVSASSVDWGISLHDGSQTYLTKSQTVPGASAWLNPAGAAETFTVSITTAGKYCLAVWKAESSSINEAGDYFLDISGTVTAVGDGSTPTRTALTSVYPNPFNPRTTLSFQLDRGGPVHVGVYGLRGELVRTLVDDVREAGRYDVVWNGTDDRGRNVSTGVYLARLRAGEAMLTRKLVLLK